MRKLAITATALALAFVAFGLAACGSSSSSTSTTSPAAAAPDGDTDTDAGAGQTGTGATITFTADPNGQLAYTQSKVTAAAGNDTIKFDNPAPLTHDVVIEDSAGNEVASTDTISGGSTTATADLKPGTYTYFCSVDSHREAGMEGTLTVN